MIITTLGHLVNAEPALSELAKNRLPAKVAYQIAKLAKKVSAETAIFQQKRDDAIKEFGTEKDGAFRVEPSQPNFGAFVLKVNELAAVVVELDAQPIPFDVLTDISAADLLALGPLVGEPA